MYFRESDAIASENLDLLEEVERLDEHLFLNQDGYVRVKDAADHISSSADVVGALLERFASDHVVTAKDIAICPKDTIPIEESGTDVTCDLCDTSYKASDLQHERIYYPRSTEWECGDEFSPTIESSYDIEGVFKIIGCSDEGRRADVVFVHGLDGDARETWHPKGEPHSFWPKWLGEEVHEIGVWSVDYDAASLKWKGTAMPLPERADNLLDRFNLAGFGSRPLIFICHSLGGLVVKQCLNHAVTMNNPDWKPIAESTKGIMFLATPHTGATMANFIKHLGWLLRNTVAVDDLERHHPRLRELNTWFTNSNLDIAVRVYYEKEKTNGVLVVDEDSANPGIQGVFPIGLDADHIEICKPQSQKSPVFARAVKMVRDCLAASAKTQ